MYKGDIMKQEIDYGAEIEQFSAELVKIGNSHFVLVPDKIIKFAGWETRDRIKLWARKIKEE